MNIYTIFINLILILKYSIIFISDVLNIKNLSSNLPYEFSEYYNKDEYAKSQQYLKANTIFQLLYSFVFLLLQLLFINFGCFNYLNTSLISLHLHPLITGMLFVNIITLACEFFKIPFSIYRIFVIEDNFGFNKMNFRTFFTDLLKSYTINTVIFNTILLIILCLLQNFNRYTWIIILLFISIFELFIVFIAPVVIMPLFNKYTAIKDGQIKESIKKYIDKEHIEMKGIFIIDGSKRSTKTNAFLTGFGKFRRIVLLDTLLKKHTVDEIISILAHEIGHYKLNHILKNIFTSFVITGMILFLASFLIMKPWIYKAFLMNKQYIYAGLIFISILYEPISVVIEIIENYLSRKYEYQADLYSIHTCHNTASMIQALKKLSVDNLTNLSPHKLKVFLNYSHPPIMERISAIQRYNKKNHHAESGT
ncbi:MAG: M48 family metallopeptidase [Endomicrobium sp.]|nr:M48 family metallopeptidase [Endomicrobium sp.]